MFSGRPSYPTPDTIGRHDPIDVETEEWRAEAMLFLAFILGLGILFAAMYSWEELRYLARGKTAEAEVLRTYQMQSRNGMYRYVEFRYRDKDGSEIEDNSGISEEWQAPASGRLQVQYIPGERRSARLAGTHNYHAVCFLAACGVALVIVCGWLWLDARAAVRELNRTS